MTGPAVKVMVVTRGDSGPSAVAALVQEAQRLQSEEERELYEVQTDGVAAQALSTQDPARPPPSGSSQYALCAGHMGAAVAVAADAVSESAALKADERQVCCRRRAEPGRQYHICACRAGQGGCRG